MTAQVGDQFATPHAQTERVVNLLLDAALQAGYFIVGVRAAGLAAGPMTGFDPAGAARRAVSSSTR